MTTWIDTADGVRLAVEGPAESLADTAVVVVHGFTASRTNADVLRLRQALEEDGLAVFTYDCRGHGRSGGICTLGDLERHDVAAVTALARRHASRVVLVGASMGAIAVLRYAAEPGEAGEVEPALDGVVAVSSPAVWQMPWSPQGVFSTVLTRTPPGRWLLERKVGVRVARKWTKPEPPLDLVARIDAPLAFVHGRHDRFIKPIAAVALHRASPTRRRLDLVAGMGHAFDPVGVPAIRAAIAWTLRLDHRPAALPG